MSIQSAELVPASLAGRGEIKAAVRSQWRHFAMAGLFSSAINILYLSSPLYLMQVYNRVLVSENISTLVLLSLVLSLSLVTMAVLDAIRSQMLIRCGIKLDEMLAGRVFDALVQQCSQRGYSNGTQKLREFDHFRAFITGPGIYFAFDLPWIPVYLILLFFIHPILGVVATIGALTLLGLAVLNEYLTRQALKRAEASGERSYTFTENILRHADVVLAMGMQPAVERYWQQNRGSMLAQQALASDRNSVITSSIRFARLLLQSLMLGAGAWLAIDHAIMPATIFAASIVMGRALVPVEQAVGTWKQFTEARAGYRRVEGLLDAVPSGRPTTILTPGDGSLVAQDLAYSVPTRSRPIISDLSFALAEGEAVGIVGPSGSGKSSLARILVGAVPASNGTIRFGGVDYSHWDRSAFGRRIGYLPQEIGIFAGTVRENIARFDDVDIDEVIEAAKLAGIHDMILELPRQYDTPLAVGGVGLSGGQRQRLGLARALLGRPSLLVLDEPNANLDTQGEAALRDALLSLKAKNTTIIVITHRNTVLEVVDSLMFVRAGRLEAMGPPNDVYAYIKANVSGPAKPSTGGA